MSMRRLFVFIILLGSFPFMAKSQDSSDPNLERYQFFREADLSTAAEVVTIQHPASGSRRFFIEWVEIFCSVDCVVTVERDGTDATGGSNLTATTINQQETIAAEGFHTSNVGVGTVIKTKLVPGNTSKALVYDAGLFMPTGADKNFTIRTDSITGKVRITITLRHT